MLMNEFDNSEIGNIQFSNQKDESMKMNEQV